MRIAIMLRALDEKGGIGIYTQNVTRELIEQDRRNEYVLLYANPVNIGRFAHYPHVTERVVRAPNKALWDQVAVPIACWRSRADVVFHPKFTVPLLAPCKSVMVLHGAGWFMPEFRQFWSSLDLKYLRVAMPIYCRRAAAVLAVSEITRETFINVLKIDPHKIRTVYFAPARHFRPIDDADALARVRRKYALPESFVLTLSGYTKGPRKNIGVILAAFERFHGRTPHKLVVGGKDCDRFRDELAIPTDGFGADVVFPGWIEQEDLPAVYAMADLFLYPSNVEAFPVPITEALACGVPIITTDANGLREIAGDAARYVDHADIPQVADALAEVLGDRELRDRLARKSLERAKRYSWERCVALTLAAIEEAGRDRRSASVSS